MDFVSAMRLAGEKPELVVVELCASGTADPKRPWLTNPLRPNRTTVDIVIGSTDDLSVIDFRPLHGLLVWLFDNVGDRRRFRRVSRLIVDAAPLRLVVPNADGTAHVWPTSPTTAEPWSATA